MVEFNEFEPNLDEIIRKRLIRSGRYEFAKHLMWLCKKFESDGEVFFDDFVKVFKLTQTRIMQILNDLINIGLIYRDSNSRGVYKPIKDDNGNLLIKKYISEYEKVIYTKKT